MLGLLQLLLAEFKSKLEVTQDSLPRKAKFPQLDAKIKVAIGMRPSVPM